MLCVCVCFTCNGHISYSLLVHRGHQDHRLGHHTGWKGLKQKQREDFQSVLLSFTAATDSEKLLQCSTLVQLLQPGTLGETWPRTIYQFVLFLIRLSRLILLGCSVFRLESVGCRQVKSISSHTLQKDAAHCKKKTSLTDGGMSYVIDYVD